MQIPGTRDDQTFTNTSAEVPHETIWSHMDDPFFGLALAFGILVLIAAVASRASPTPRQHLARGVVAALVVLGLVVFTNELSNIGRLTMRLSVWLPFFGAAAIGYVAAILLEWALRALMPHQKRD